MNIISDYNDINKIEERKAADYALETALKYGATDARIMLNMGEQNSISILDGNLDILHGSSDRSMYLQIYINGKYGCYSTNIFNKESLDQFIRNAISGSNLLTPDKSRTLPDQSLYFNKFRECSAAERLKKTDLGQFDPKFFSFDPERKREIAMETYETMEQQSYRGNKRGALISGSVEYADLVEYFYMKDSNGFIGESFQTTFSISSEVSVKGVKNARPEGWWYESEMFLNDFIDPKIYKNTGIKALQRAQRKIDPKKIRSGKYNVVLDTTCSTRLIAPILSAISGANLQQKNSFLLDSLGKKIFSEKMTLTDKPHMFGMTGSRFFDSEGVATKNSKIITNGVLNRYFINTYYANKMGMKAGVEGASVPILTDGKNYKDAEELIRLTGDGIYITEFNGGNCNGGTGDFSYGISGFYYENGEIKFPVNEMNITGNIITLWNDFIACANDARRCTRWQIGSLAFENVNGC